VIWKPQKRGGHVPRWDYILSGGDHLEEKVSKMLYICDASRGDAACWDTA